MVQDLSNSWSNVTKVVRTIQNRMVEIVADMNVLLGIILKIKDVYQKALDTMRDSLEGGYIRPWEVTQESVFLPLQVNKRTFLDSVTEQLVILRNASFADPAVKKYVRVLFYENIAVKVRLLDEASRFSEKIFNIYSDKEVDVDEIRNPTKRGMLYKVPIMALKDNDQNISELRFNFLQHLKMAKEQVRLLETAASNLSVNITSVRARYEEEMNELAVLRYRFKTGVVDPCRSKLLDRFSNFQRAWEKVLKEGNDTIITVDATKTLVRGFKDRKGPQTFMDRLLQKSKAYINSTNLSVTKISLASEMKSVKIVSKIQQIDVFFTAARARARNFDHDWGKYRGAYLDLWDLVHNDPAMFEFFKNKHYPYIENMPQRSMERLIWDETKEGKFHFPGNDTHLNILKGEFKATLKKCNIANSINDADKQFFTNLDEWQSALTSFKDSTAINEQFIR